MPPPSQRLEGWRRWRARARGGHARERCGGQEGNATQDRASGIAAAQSSVTLAAERADAHHQRGLSGNIKFAWSSRASESSVCVLAEMFIGPSEVTVVWLRGSFAKPEKTHCTGVVMLCRLTGFGC